MNGGAKHRTPVACLKRFQCALNTKLVRWHKWSKEEDQMLYNAVKVCMCVYVCTWVGFWGGGGEGLIFCLC